MSELTYSALAADRHASQRPDAISVRYRPACRADTQLADISAAARTLGARLKADRAGIYLAPWS